MNFHRLVVTKPESNKINKQTSKKKKGNKEKETKMNKIERSVIN